MGLIRFLFALAVTIAHIGYIPFYEGISSLLAVQGFYVISGFLITLAWDTKYSLQPNSIRLFYTNRAARIFFLYWSVLLLSIAAGAIFHGFFHDWPDYMVVNPHLPLKLIAYQLVSNFSLIGASVALFLGTSPEGSLYFTSDFTTSAFPVWRLLIIAPAWTLELELWFYLLAPFLLRLRFPWIAGIAAISFAARFAWYQAGHNVDPWTYRFFPFELGVFLLGVIAYRVFTLVDWSRMRWISMSVFLGTVASIVFFGRTDFYLHPYIYLTLFAATLPAVFGLTHAWTIDRFLADLSFPLYLVHWPIMLLVRDLPKPLPVWPGMIGILLSISAAAALVVLVERPIDRWRQSRIRGRKAAAKKFTEPSIVTN